MSIKQTITRAVFRSGLHIRKLSPEILIGAGIVGVVGTAIMASKATLRLSEVVEELEHDQDVIDMVRDSKNEAEYPTRAYELDQIKAKAKFGVGVLKLYLPAISMGALSVACFLGSHNIMSRRNAALLAAYKLLERSFEDYRERVKERFELEDDSDLRFPVEGHKGEIVTEDGATAGWDGTKAGFDDPNDISIYARFFDETNPQFDRRDATMNLAFLKAQQNYANNKLQIQGHLFLNEVYDMLGIPRTKAGAVVGWVISEDGDNHVDFGVYDRASEVKRDFVNGYEKAILLDFNVDGVIYDKI